MKLRHQATVDAPRDQVWSLLMDVPRVASCVPGVETVTALGADRFTGHFRVSVGPVKLALDGQLELVERDDRSGRAVMRASGTDTRLGGSVSATVALEMTGDGPTSVVIDSDVQILGRLGELGQPLIRRKADDIMAAFARNLASAVGELAR